MCHIFQQTEPLVCKTVYTLSMLDIRTNAMIMKELVASNAKKISTKFIQICVTSLSIEFAPALKNLLDIN